MINLPIKPLKRYSKGEENFLIKYYPKKGKNWCAIKLNRSKNSVRTIASKLRLYLDKNSIFYKKSRIQAGRKLRGRKRPEHSFLMKKYVKEGRLPVFGKKTLEDRKKYSEYAKKWIKEKGHPRGMLGKKQTEKCKKAVSMRSKKMWANKNSFVNSREYRQILSDRAMKLHQSIWKTKGDNYSNCKYGIYDINGKKIFFRSTWESNYALYLDFLIKNKEIKSWEYEKDTFWFEKIKRGVRSYKPDFKILNNNGTVEYHEVKGWMNAKSKTKLKRMKKYYPGIKMVLIDEDCYKDIKKKLGKALGFY